MTEKGYIANFTCIYILIGKQLFRRTAETDQIKSVADKSFGRKLTVDFFHYETFLGRCDQSAHQQCPLC